MGYQEAFFKPKKESMGAFENFIELNKEEVENPPWDYCSIPSTVLFKQDVFGQTTYGDRSELFRKGDKYFWAVGQRSGVFWLPRLFSDYGFEVEGVLIEDVPYFIFEGLKEFMNQHWNNPDRPTFENEYIVVKQVQYI